MKDVLETVVRTPMSGLIPALGLVLIVWGVAPGLCLRLISLCFHKDDPRRREMIAELYAVPRWEQPFWVAQQLERSVTEGLFGRVLDFFDGRLYNRWYLTDGVAMNADSPDTFEIPEPHHKACIRPGDLVKLGFVAPRECGERMWVTVTKVRGEKYWGKLSNTPVFIPATHAGMKLKFRGKHIIGLYCDEQFERAELVEAGF